VVETARCRRGRFSWWLPFRTGALAILGCSLAALLAGGVSAADPSFTQPASSPIATGSGAISVAAADLNGDTRPDLAVANQGANNVSILLQNSTGLFGFSAAGSITVGTQPVSVVVADLNGDGKPDLAVANADEAAPNGTVSILLQNSTGPFGFSLAGSPVPVGTAPQSIAVGHLNDNVDLKPDLAVVNEGSDNVTILRQNSTGPFGFTATTVSLDVGALPQSIAAADFNGDSNTDLATANEHLNTLTILFGNGSGSFPPPSTTIPVGAGPSDVASSDLNGDGRFDLAVANATSNNVSILIGNGNGTFANGSTSPVTVGTGPEGTAAADYNLDGKVDLAVANTGAGPPGDLTILLGNGTGGFTAFAPTVPAYTEPTTVAAADLNGDSKPDLAVANYGSGNVMVQLNTTSGTTAVTLRGFIARATRKGVELRWRTAQETGVIGFHVYRSDVKLNRTLIAARGSGTAGAAYRLLDRHARIGAVSSYHLQAVRADGTRAWLGRASTKR
jgi:VCBS repeat protein/FG-GAP repeat protein